MELQGKVIAALPERSGVSARGEWKSQEFVIEYQEGQYPRHLVFTVFGADRLQRFNIQIGQTLTLMSGMVVGLLMFAHLMFASLTLMPLLLLLRQPQF